MGIFKTEIKANYYIMFWRVMDHLKLQIFVDHDTNGRAGSIRNIEGSPRAYFHPLRPSYQNRNMVVAVKIKSPLRLITRNIL